MSLTTDDKLFSTDPDTLSELFLSSETEGEIEEEDT